MAQLLCLLGDKREGKIIVIDGSLTQDQLPSLIAQGIDRVVSGSALFRDDRLAENTRAGEAMFKGCRGYYFLTLHSINAGWRLYLIRAYISTRLVGLISYSTSSDIDWQLSLFSASAAFTITAKASAFRRRRLPARRRCPAAAVRHVGGV